MRSYVDTGSRWVASTSWSAIACGAFVALALQVLFYWFGLAVALADGQAGEGYRLWVVLVQLASLAIGGALAARISHADQRAGGVAAGVMTWAVALVLGVVLGGFAPLTAGTSGPAWAAFLGGLFALGAAILGGLVGAAPGERPTASLPATSLPSTTMRTEEPIHHPA